LTCGGGRDRAGLVSLLVLALAGVTPEAIADDYELSLPQMQPLFAALGLQHREPSMHAFLQERGTTVRGSILDLLHGLDVEKYLAGAGIPGVDIAALRSRLVGRMSPWAAKDGAGGSSS
jgi:hypothetical protein